MPDFRKKDFQVMNTLTFEEIRTCQYELLEFMDAFCRKNNIQYYLAFGTLLGAVRHRGFIPWDDDIDVCMFRSEYERFKQSMLNETGNIRLITLDAAEYFFPFGRLCNISTYSTIGNRRSYGVSMDIYVMDELPDDKIENERFCSSIYKEIRKSDFWKRMIARVLFHSHLRPRLLESIQKHHSKRILALAQRYNGKGNEFVADLCGTRVIQPLPRKLFSNDIRLKFESGYFQAPEQYDAILSILYGDYMTPPPEDQRVPYHRGQYYHL